MVLHWQSQAQEFFDIAAPGTRPKGSDRSMMLSERVF
jgi:hypothetical protein